MLYMVVWLLSAFGVNFSFLYAPTPLGIAISVGIVILGALNLTLDFAFIEKAAAGAPRFMQWYGAFGLMLSLIWIYVSVLRLLALLRARQWTNGAPTTMSSSSEDRVNQSKEIKLQSAEDKNRETKYPLAALQRQPASFARVLVVLASVVVVCAGMYVAAGPILNPIFFALTLALIFSPVYAWLRRHLPTLLALLIMMIGLVALTFGLVMLLSTSLSRFTTELSFYTVQWDDQLAQLQARLDELGLATLDLSSVFDPSVMATVLSTIAGAILGFLSDLFLILVLVLFFLAEGPAMMRRLQASVEERDPRIEQLFVVGKGVTHQFALRAVVNLATGAAVTLLLLVVGVSYPLLWGVLTFFLSYVPYIGLWVAMIPPTLLALAESGLGWAIVVIIGVLVINVLAENALSPYLMGRGLNLSPTVVFFSFIFWIFLLGAPGAFLAMPLTLFLVALLSTYPEASWLVSLMVAQEPTITEEVPPADTGDSTA